MTGKDGIEGTEPRPLVTSALVALPYRSKSAFTDLQISVFLCPCPLRDKAQHFVLHLGSILGADGFELSVQFLREVYGQSRQLLGAGHGWPRRIGR
jgi:hypothetical protein